MMTNKNETEQLAEYRANELLKEFNLGIQGIEDIFSFLEDVLGYLVIRYPMGENTVDGMALRFRGEKVIFTNSSKSLGREIFTAAHELGHHVMDLEEKDNYQIVDTETGDFDEAKQIEYRADFFAACLLMPEEGVKSSFTKIRKQSSDITPLLGIRLMTEFNVSYQAMVRRLRNLDLLTYDEAQRLYNYREFTGFNLHDLFGLHSLDTRLLDKTEKIHFPKRYLESFRYNVENQKIPVSSAEKIARILGKSLNELGIRVMNYEGEPDDDKIDYEKILRSLKEK